MNTHEIERIAAAINQARPDWPAKQLHTLLTNPRLTHRPRRDVFVALAWVAADPTTTSPYRVLEAGPWWQAAATEPTTPPRNPYDPNDNCSTCSLPRDQCRTRWAGDHPFTSAAAYARTVNHDPDRIARIIESVKAETTPMRDPAAPLEARVAERDYADCDTAIAAAMARGRHGEAQYLAIRCAQLHAEQPQPPTP